MVASFRGQRAPASAHPSTLERVFREKGVSILVVGKGKVGTELLEQIRAQRTELERDHDVVVRVVGVADRRGALLDEAGVDLDRWREELAAAPAGGPLDARSAPELLDRLSLLPRPVLVDVTAAEGMEEVYAQAFRRGIDVVSSNKRPLAVAPRALDALRQERRAHHRHHRYDAAVGASLPVIGTLRRLVQGGDRVKEVVGSLSGTLGYVCTEIARGVPLSLAVRWAIGLGYAETDPRADLSGEDTARKALILARELGANLALEEVRVEPFVPQPLLVPGGPDALIASLRAHDATIAAEVERLAREGSVLRYLARIVAGPDGRFSVSAGPVAVPASEPAARLVGVEAMVAFTTARHSERPLVVQGAGVGAASTAGTVIADVFRGVGTGAR
jgi:homoserine dehydrogenase